MFYQQYWLKWRIMKADELLTTQLTKREQIEYILKKAEKQQSSQSKQIQSTNNRVHLMRAIFIAIDLSDSINIKDIKPSRLSVTVEMIRRMIRSVKDRTPICKFVIGKVQNQLCKPMCNFIHNQTTLIEILDGLKTIHSPGFFSLENTLSVALECFDNIPNTYHKQLLIIQSSPFTKDYRDVYKTIEIFHQSKISINVASLVGWTFVFQKLVEACQGRYVTIGSQREFEEFIDVVGENPIFGGEKVVKKLVKMSLARRQYAAESARKQCFCHLEPVKEYFVCGMCSAVLCQKMPSQCAICMTMLVFPSDLYRSKN